jgi:hypothetical protein
MRTFERIGKVGFANTTVLTIASDGKKSSV